MRVIAVAEEEEALVSALDLETVEAGEGGVCAEVAIALPDFVSVGGGDLADEGNDGALEVEGDLHVEVAHAAEHRYDAREAAAPLAPGIAVVEAEEDKRNVGGATAESLLQGVPASGVLKGDISAGSGEGAGGEEVVETNSEVERRFSIRNVTTVKNSGDLVSDFFLREGIGFCLD